PSTTTGPTLATTAASKSLKSCSQMLEWSPVSAHSSLMLSKVILCLRRFAGVSKLLLQDQTTRLTPMRGILNQQSTWVGSIQIWKRQTKTPLPDRREEEACVTRFLSLPAGPGRR